MKYFSTLVLIFLGHVVFGQIGATLANPYADITNSDVLNFRVYDEYKGSPYLFDEFLAGKITLNDGTDKAFDSLKMDCYKNQILYKSKGRIFALDNGKLDELFFYQGSRQFKQIALDGENKWYQILFVGRVSLYKHYKVDLIVEDRQSASSYGGNTDVNKKIFSRKEDYFFSILPDMSVTEIPSGKKEFINQFSVHHVDIESFIKSNKLKLNNDEDLTKIFKELNRK